ncbi:thioredoxin [Limosilactobacillus agrestis]|uniref:Thioredoxin n=1 Tax=Limosilactobacillus agrestis TaxID=2759748 RepID=A0A7W3UH99_9LACO|nr:thioredoxin [Limosilactobacillus agrestis]MBB1095512.1 thioredoxin [Limosilactobacillus agrestis]MBB1098764.1 thioredoxin [Limosilactobacillus agrestis]MCD7113612.1 thioredoxin [Limosilactobacillus agrestis]MCD7125729.1 thioredoxin [Limosilactobacillus agrestis]MCD7130235.1 thioredoxin [Limosilactobacillus agrestis]
MSVQETTDQSFAKDTSTGITVTDFWATWCGPCRMQSPAVEKVADELSNVKFTKMDVDSNPETAKNLGIMSIPTLVIKKDGVVVKQLVGYHSPEQIKNVLNNYNWKGND